MVPKLFRVGDRVLVFDNRLYKDDISTPLSVTMKPATVVDAYYFDMVDVRFDHRPDEVSRGHFTSYMELIDG